MHPIHIRWGLWGGFLVPSKAGGKWIRYDALKQPLLLSPLRTLLSIGRNCWINWHKQECGRTSKNRSGRCMEWTRRRSWGEPKEWLQVVVLLLLSNKRYSPYGRAPLRTREELILSFPGFFQLSSILPLPQPPLFICIITKYAHNVAVLVQNCQACDMPITEVSNVKLIISSKETGSSPSIAFCLFTRSCKLQFADNPFFLTW